MSDRATLRGVIFTLVVIAMFLVAFLIGVRFSRADPPPGTHDPAISEWFHSLKQPGTGYICCTMSDGRPVTTRYTNGKLEAFVDKKSFGASAPDAWLVVPENVMIRGIENPNGEPILFWYQGEIRCFVEASGT